MYIVRKFARWLFSRFCFSKSRIAKITTARKKTTFTVLGPLLFIVFINDLPDIVGCKCKVFADDTKIYESTDKHELIQQDLLNLLDWSDKWNLKFNASKCKVLHIGRTNPRYPYFMDREMTQELEHTKEEKDVGVTFDEKLSFDAHIQKCINKGNQMSGLVKRSFQYLDPDMFIKLYKSFV